MSLYTTERLIIRPWEVTDVTDLYEYGKSELVGPSAGWTPHKDEAESLDIIKMFMDSDDTFAIVLKSENKVIGGMGLHRSEPDENEKDLKQREIGYVLNPAYWGNGYVPEAVNGMLAYGFNALELDQIWCAHFDFNEKSKRVNEKCGFEYQFTKPQVLTRLGNKEVHTLFYKMTKNAFLLNV